ncbi:MAG: menaquinol-cytochrome C reductase, partial [Gemmatimonadaceae bacterium]
GKGSPDMTGYASKEWMIAFVSDPSHERFFGDNNDRMPSFGKEKTLTLQELGLVADWLRGDWFMPPKSVAQRN